MATVPGVSSAARPDGAWSTIDPVGEPAPAGLPSNELPGTIAART